MKLVPMQELLFAESETLQQNLRICYEELQKINIEINANTIIKEYDKIGKEILKQNEVLKRGQR